jgi:hypothetical protein
MKPVRLPISFCHAVCPKCGLPTEFKSFKSGGMGGDFSTYIGSATGALYRLNREKIYYQKLSEDSLLAAAIAKEGSLRNTMEITCKICGEVFSAQHAGLDGEEFVDAYEL